MNEISQRAKRVRALERDRQRKRKNYRDMKARGEKRAPANVTEAKRNLYNERRRAKAARLRKPPHLERFGARRGFGIVTRSNLAADLTKWYGPGMIKERKLEAEATRILKAAGWKASLIKRCTA